MLWFKFRVVELTSSIRHRLAYAWHNFRSDDKQRDACFFLIFTLNSRGQPIYLNQPHVFAKGNYIEQIYQYLGNLISYLKNIVNT